jgi:hypothetical protein
MPFTRGPLRSDTFPTGTADDTTQWPLPEDNIPFTYSTPPASRPGLRISMSTSTLRSRYRTEYQEVGRRAAPRFPPQVASDWYDDDPLRSSLTSGMTSRSSVEQTSGTERSSVLTKSSSITDLSPETPDGYSVEMSVEDAIEMYLDDILDLPEDSATVQAVPGVYDMPVVPEDPLPEKPFQETTQEVAPESPLLEEEKTIPSNEPIPEDKESVLERIGEAIDTPMEVTTPKPLEAPKPEEIADLSPLSPRESKVVELPGVVPPSFISGSDAHDRYGFRKATHHVTRSQFDSWSGSYASFAEHRRLKWVELLESSGLPSQAPVTFPPKSSKIKRYVRKGIPSEYRGSAWFYYAGGFDHMHRHPGHYAELVQRAMDSPSDDDKEHIERDLHRTFPDNIHFKPVDAGDDADAGSSNPRYRSITVETEMIRSLRRVLYAFALHNPRIGYTQSLNFITGMLLLFLPEEKAFWMLHIITSDYLPATHEISLEGANVDLWILMVLLKETLPGIYTKVASSGPTTSRARPPALTVKTRLPDITLGLTNWLMSLFIGSLPLETTLRVWDCFFYEGSKTFFRVALAIFKASEREILAVSDPMEVFQIVQSTPKKLLDANALIDESLARRYRVGQRRIDDLREARRTAIRQEKTRLSLVTGKALGVALAGDTTAERPFTRTEARSPLPKLEREIVGSWRQIKQHAFK